MPKGPSGAFVIRADALDPKRVRRFWSKVQKTRGCWKWVGATNPGGYGQFSIGQKAPGRALLASAHRVSYALAHGEAPAGMVIRHTCDNTRCVKPDHLLLGSQADNMRDHMERGLRCKLTWRDVQAIRASKRSPSTIAARYGVTPQTATKVIRNTTWVDPRYTPPAPRNRGESHHSARLTNADVVEARAAHVTGETIRSLALRYGVAYSTMWEAINKASWKAA